MTEVAEVLYLAKSRATGCWEHGSARRSDGYVDITQSTPDRNGFATDPEQVFAAGWSASFDGTIALASLKVKIVLSDSNEIDGSINLCLVDGSYFLQGRLDASLSDMPPEVARMLAILPQQTGPHSKAIRGNIDVMIETV